MNKYLLNPASICSSGDTRMICIFFQLCSLACQTISPRCANANLVLEAQTCAFDFHHDGIVK